jgi:hypothetical protein
LYGFNQENQDSVRQKKNGLLKPDQWYDKRLVIQPAGMRLFMHFFPKIYI